MVGKNQIQIAGTQFAAGMSTSDLLGDGALGTSSYNLSLVSPPGAVRASAVQSISGTLPDDILASCEDPRTSGSAQRYYVDDSGNILSISLNDSGGGGNSISTAATPASSSGYTELITDMAVFNGNIYITKTSNIVQATVGSPWTLDETWWTVTKGQSSLNVSGNVHHPLLSFENFLWIGDLNKLHNVDSSGTVSSGVLTLNQNERIDCLGIDPQTGLMMIGVRTASGDDTSQTSRAFIYLYDGYSSKPRRKIQIEGLITGFQAIGGTVYVGVDNTITVWNGSGVTFLRRLTTLSGNSSGLPYKNRMSRLQNHLVVVDGQQVLAYGEILPGKKVWWPLFKNQATTDNITFMAYGGSTLQFNSPRVPNMPCIIVNYAITTVKAVSPFDQVNVGTGKMYVANINFERPVNIRRARVVTSGITSANGGTTGIGKLELVDENGVANATAQPKFVVASGTRYVFDFDFGGLKLQTLGGVVTLDTQAFQVLKVILYYDVAE